MKKLLPAQRFTINFLRLKPGVVGGYRPKALVQAVERDGRFSAFAADGVSCPKVSYVTRTGH